MIRNHFTALSRPSLNFHEKDKLTHLIPYVPASAPLAYPIQPYPILSTSTFPLAVYGQGSRWREQRWTETEEAVDSLRARIGAEKGHEVDCICGHDRADIGEGEENRLSKGNMHDGSNLVCCSSWRGKILTCQSGRFYLSHRLNRLSSDRGDSCYKYMHLVLYSWLIAGTPTENRKFQWWEGSTMSERARPLYFILCNERCLRRVPIVGHVPSRFGSCGPFVHDFDSGLHLWPREDGRLAIAFVRVGLMFASRSRSGR